MKKVFFTFLLSLLVVTLSTGCKKVIKALFKGVEVPLTEVRITVPVNPAAPPLYTGVLTMPRITQHFNLDSLIKANTNNQFGSADVTSVKIKEMTATIVEGATQTNNFSNFEYIRVGLSSDNNSTSTQIASYDFPDTYTTTANIASANNPELASYLHGTALYYDITVKPRRAITQPFTVTIKATVIAQ